MVITHPWGFDYGFSCVIQNISSCMYIISGLRAQNHVLATRPMPWNGRSLILRSHSHGVQMSEAVCCYKMQQTLAAQCSMNWWEAVFQEVNSTQSYNHLGFSVSVFTFYFHQFSLLGWPNDSFQNCRHWTHTIFLCGVQDWQSQDEALSHICQDAETPGQLRIETQGKERRNPDMAWTCTKWFDILRYFWSQRTIVLWCIAVSLFCVDKSRFLKTYSLLPALFAENSCSVAAIFAKWCS